MVNPSLPRRLLASVSLLTVIGLGMALGHVHSAGARPDAEPGGGAARGQEGTPDPRRVKVFHIRNRNPQEIATVLETLLPSPPAPAMPTINQGGGALGVLGGQPALGALGALGAGGGALGLSSGGMLGALGGTAAPGATALHAPEPSRESWRVATDLRTQSLVVRATDRHLQVASDLVTLLDFPSDKAPPRLKTLRAYRLRHAQPSPWPVCLPRSTTRLFRR